MAITRRDLFRTGVVLSAAATAVPSLTAAADEAGPTIWSAPQWGARPPKGSVLVLNRKPAFIVVHHTATANVVDVGKDRAFRLSRAIQKYHMDSRGWIDSGQQFTNSRGGHITEGRHRSLEAVRGGTRHVQGANVANRNSEVIGIENEGTYITAGPPQAQWDSLVALVAYIAHRYAIPPSRIRGHRDFSNTQCPGNTLYRRLPELRAAVAARIGSGDAEPLDWPLLAPGDSGKRVLAAQHLLRDRGELDVTADGVFGPSTFAAMSRFAAKSGLVDEPCYPVAVADESGLIGGAAWPALIRAVDPGDGSEAAMAARALASGRDRIESSDWLALLNQ